MVYTSAIPFAPKGVSLGSKYIEVAHYAPKGINPALQPGHWVMTGSSKNPINYVMSGVVGTKGYPFSNASTTLVPKSSLKWPAGWEKVKGTFGQRVYKP